MAEIAAIIILLGSLSGIIVILLRKIPVLIELPAQAAKAPFVRQLKIKAKKLSSLERLNFENFLEKILRRIKILSLKIENKVGSQLEKLRQRSVKQEKKLQDGYWQEVRKDNKNPRAKRE